jgi:hypothetical protein
MAPTGGDGVTPELTLAWARAIARAYDDPAFRRRLQSGAVKVLYVEFGVETDKDTVENLTPTLADALREIDKQEKLLRAARETTSGTSASAVSFGTPIMQPVPAPYPVPVYVSVPPQTRGYYSPPPPPSGYYAPPPHPYASPAPASFYATVQPYASGMQGGPIWPWASIYASQVATTRTVTETRASPPQWLGGPPSVGQLSMS